MTEPTQAQATTDDEVTFGDKRVELSDYDRYKGRKGVTDRLAVISPTLVRAFIHFHRSAQGGGSFRCLSPGSDPMAVCCEHKGTPDQRFGIVVFHYFTDDEGVLVNDDKLTGKIKLWCITESRYGALTDLHKEWPLLNGGFEAPQHDITLKCTEEQFQKMTITVAKKAHWKTKQAWYDALTKKFPKAREKVLLALGRTLKEAEIMERLGLSLPSQTGGTDKAGDVDLGDVLAD